MNKLILIFGILMISFSTFAQSFPFKIQKSELFKDECKESQIVLSEDDGNGGILIVRSYEASFSGKNGYYIEHYDSNLNLIKEFNYEMKHTGTQKYKFALGVFTMLDNLNIVQVFYDINERAYICLAHSINKNDFNTTQKELFRFTREEIKQYGSFELIDSFHNSIQNGSVLNGDFASKGNRNTFSLNPFNTKQATNSSSGNNSGIAIVVNKDKNAFSIGIDFNSTKSEALKLYLFDDKLNKKKELIYSREIKDRKYIFQNINLSKDGNSIYLLGKSFTPNQKSKEKGGKYQFEITKFTQDKEVTNTFDTEEHFIGSLKTIALEDRLICVGFYSDIDDSKYKGISYFKLDVNSLEVLKAKYNPFSEQFIIDKYGEDKDKELKYLTFKNYFITKNNELLFNAQEEYSTTSSNATFGMNGMGGGYQTYYHCDDIVSAKLSNEGDLVWARNINKKQGYQYDDNYVSYTASIVGDMSYYFINAGEEIKKLDKNRIEFKDSNKNRSNLYVIKIKDNGDFEFEKILEEEENEVPFVVSKGIQLGNSVFFLGRRGSKKQLLKVAL
ncbi:hypothetical protein FNW52_17860 [Flavobacterium sp. ZT3R18]|uniref:hypothetical protein n=1 Tax=Flavobacterium sp. ZT3R18 TaxID=2594429 RepID=UPI00117BB358|nr:hypothetical protein [Flavobacterium sp. ZT3R18]TRX32063.1 hypothetical protein FNW52_17860 [Flavobacterium sp. ZT3R18]